jgi:hypothetical protein
MALVHMAECYQKMGDAESRKIFEQVVKEYADQKEAVTLARARLGGTGVSTGKVARLVSSFLNGPKMEDKGMVSVDGHYVPAIDWDTGDLVLHEIATGVDRRLTETRQKGDIKEYVEESAISRDSKQVAYTWHKDNNRHELRLANLVGAPNPRPLYDNPDVEWIAPQDWAPDGRSLAVSIRRIDRTTQIGLVSVPNGSLRIVKSLDWRGTGRVFFSPDGKYLA